MFASACTPALKLTPSDAPTVLAHQVLEAAAEDVHCVAHSFVVLTANRCCSVTTDPVNDLVGNDQDQVEAAVNQGQTRAAVDSQEEDDRELPGHGIELCVGQGDPKALIEQCAPCDERSPV